MADIPPAKNHVRQPRMNAHVPGRLAMFRNGTVGIQHIQPLQQRHGLLPVRGRGRVNPVQLSRRPRAPLRQFQHQGGEVRFLYFRRGELGQAELGGLTPKPVTGARLNPTGPALALLRRRFRHPAGHQPCHAAVGIKHRPALLTAVDDDAHAFNGETRFSDSGGQNHLAITVGRRRDGPVLLLAFQVAVQRRHDHLIACLTLKLALNPTNLARTGQKNQQRPTLIRQGLMNNGHHLFFYPAIARNRTIRHLHRERPAFTTQHRHIAQQPGDGCGIQRGGHHDDPQVLPQSLAGLPNQRQPKIGLQ